MKLIKTNIFSERKRDGKGSYDNSYFKVHQCSDDTIFDKYFRESEQGVLTLISQEDFDKFNLK